jgi:membrane protein required for colicin V production
MHWFDVGLTIALILSGIWSCFRGLVRELLSLAGLAVASVLAVRGAPSVAHILAPVITVPWVSQAVGFALIFLAVMIVAMLCTKLLRLVLTAVGLSPLDRLLGGVFGLIKVVLVVSIGLMMANKFFPTFRPQLEADSVLAPLLFRNVEWLATFLNQHDDLLQHLPPPLR